MNWNDFRLKMRVLFKRDRADRDLDEELALHVEMETRKNLTLGMDSAEARRQALMKFGGVVRVTEECRDARGINLIDSVIQDIRYGLRTLRQNPGFTAVVVTILALGIGVNTAVFTVTNAMLFGGMPGVDPSGRILYVNSQTARSTTGGVSYLDFEDWRAQARSFADMAAVNLGAFAVSVGDQNGLPGTYDACELSTNSFQVLGQRPVLGRDFVASDATLGAAPVTILSYGLWTNWYGQNPAIVGQTVRIDDVPTEVIGVMPRGFEFPMNGVNLWVPFVPTRLRFGRNFQQRDTRSLMFVFGRMADGVTVETARTEMETIGNRLAIAYPETNRGVVPRVRTFTELFVGLFVGPNAATTYWAMWSAVGFVLLIACANVANLMLARAIGRTREVSLRSALGAGRWRVIRQLLIESVMLSAMGGVGGLAIAALSVSAYQRVEDSNANYMQWAYTMDSRVFAYLLAISLLTGLAFGLAPALRLSRLDINAVLKDGGRGSMGGKRRKHVSALLVIGEMALAVVLLAGAGVLIRSFLNVYTADRGIETTNILTSSVWLPAQKYSSAQAAMAFWDRLTTRLEAVPGVESVALASSVPGGRTTQRPYEVAGAPAVEEKLRPTLSVVAISPDYFRTLAARVLSGRPFTNADGGSGIPVVIVNKQFADTIWPSEDPLGKRLRLFDAETPEDWRTVVGVASNIIQNDSTAQRFEPVVYVPFRQNQASEVDEVFVRTGVPPGPFRSALLREIYTIDTNVRLGQGIAQNPRTLTEALAGNFASRGLNAGLFLVFAAVGLVLAAVGLYAVVAHSVGRRTQEIGIRVAMGATVGDIRTMVLRQGMIPPAIGLIIGLAASFAVNRVLESQLVGVSPSDPVALSAALAVLVLAAFLGCWIPTRRATRVDPVVALRHE